MRSSDMMPKAGGVSPMIPRHVLRVGQTVHIDSRQEAAGGGPASPRDSWDLDISLENLNQLIQELDPTFELVQGNDSTPSDTFSLESPHGCTLLPRGCSPDPSPSQLRTMSPSVAIPSQGSVSCSPQGVLVFSGSPTCSLPPLPSGSAPRRRNDDSQGSLRPSHSNRNSAISLLSTSTCSDTSYVLGSSLSLGGDDTDGPDSFLSSVVGSFTDESRMTDPPEKPPLVKRGLLQELGSKEPCLSPAPLPDPPSEVPILLVNGAPRLDLHAYIAGPDMDWIQTAPGPGCSRFQEASMKFVMDTSRFWFRPHIGRAEAEVLVKDQEAGAFVVRDSTSFRGSFGLVMKVEPTETTGDFIRHFLIESTPRGVRVRGSSQEPYFGSLSALVYQHTISAYALPCRLLLHPPGPGSVEKETQAAEDQQNKSACNFIYLNAVATETLTGPRAVQRAVSSTLHTASLTPAVVNLKASSKGITLTDINRRLFFRRHYPAHLISHGGEDPELRLWRRGCSFSARMFGFVARGVDAGVENVCHVFAEFDPLQPCDGILEVIQEVIQVTQAGPTNTRRPL